MLAPRDCMYDITPLMVLNDFWLRKLCLQQQQQQQQRALFA